MLPEFLHLIVSWLLVPVISCLLIAAAFSVYELGLAFGERFGGLRQWHELSIEKIEKMARRRIDRADLIARLAPMLGLMGTLIPLGPGLAALGRGDVAVLASAVTVAFDTTVIGLFAGGIGFLLSRLRRRWYDKILDEKENRL